MSTIKKTTPTKKVRVSQLKNFKCRTESPDPLSLPDITALPSPDITALPSPDRSSIEDEPQPEPLERDSDVKVRKTRRDIFALSSSSEDDDPTWTPRKTPKRSPSRPIRPFPRAPFQPLRSLKPTSSPSQRVEKPTAKGRNRHIYGISRPFRASPLTQDSVRAHQPLRSPVPQPASLISRCVSADFEKLDNRVRIGAMQSHLDAMESIEQWLDVTGGGKDQRNEGEACA